MASYLIDMYCLGVKDTFYRLRVSEWEVEELMNQQQVEFRECTYNEAHNRVYGAIAFAEEGGIEPHKDFNLTQYMLEEDTEDIPLIDYEYGLDGKHHLVCNSLSEANRYLPILHEHLGNDFDYAINGQEFGDTFDEDDTYDYDDEPDIENGEPVNIYDCLGSSDEEEIIILAHSLGIRLTPDGNLMQLRQQYVSEILKNPIDTLMRLPNRDLAALEVLATKSDDKRLIPYPNTSEDPVMFQLGFITPEKETDTFVLYRVAEDFWEATRRHITEVKEQEANKARITIESIICGLANLYGFINVHDIKHYLATLMDMPYEAASELFEIVFSHSAILTLMINKGDTNTKLNDDNYESIVGFSSRYGWDAPHELVKKIALRDKIAPKRYEYSLEEVIEADVPIPIIRNKCQKEFTHLLRDGFKYDIMQTEIICHNLWLRAQHEEDPDNYLDRYLNYFAQEVIEKAPRTPNNKMIGEAMQALQKYMNAMPRWFLKGFTPDEVVKLRI